MMASGKAHWYERLWTARVRGLFASSVQSGPGNTNNETMKKTSTLLAVLVAACAIHPGQAQYGTDVINKTINFELHVVESTYQGDFDGDGWADPTISTELSLNGEIAGAYTCETWDCEGLPCTKTGTTEGWWARTNIPHDSYISLRGRTWESDGEFDCYYDPTYDAWYWGGNYTLRDGATEMPIIYPSPDFTPGSWNPWLASGTTWLLPNNPTFDQRMEMTWRYTAGSGWDNLLNLGTVDMNTTKRDVNSNRTVPNQRSLVNLNYTNQQGDAAPDVFYRFHLDEPSRVTITTNCNPTNFDTKIHLFALPSTGLIVSDDDGGGAGGTSQIIRELCAGDHAVIVEGYQANTGTFCLNVTAQAPTPLAISIVENSGTSCPDANDGAVSWAASGGIGALQYIINEVDVINVTSVGNRPVGPFNIRVIDACGSSANTTVNVVSMDDTPPTALCLAALSIEVIEGENTVITAQDVDNGSSDNCGEIALSVSPSSFSTSDVGLQSAVLTVTDENDNASTCTCAVTVENVTGIEESATSARVRVLPNPSDGHFRIDLAELGLSPDTRLDIHDALGRAVFNTNPNKSIVDVDLAHLPNGTYIMRVSDPQWSAVKRIVVQH